jgi:signal transduction histidine kinase
MKPGAPLRYAGLALILLMAGIAAVGFYTIRKDVENLRTISKDNFLWSATQMEVELLRFQTSLAMLTAEPSEDALEAVQRRFDILWSRVVVMEEGEAGETLRSYDDGHVTLDRLKAFLQENDRTVTGLTLAGDTTAIRSLLDQIEKVREDTRHYTLRVHRGDAAKTSAVWDRIQQSSQTTGAISLTAVLVSVLSIGLILRDNRRQRGVAEMNLRVAREAEQASRTKSRFLTMMSHELRTPLNGVLGPLALLGQSEMASKHGRLVEQAQQSGDSLLRMLTGLLEFSEMQDERFELAHEPFRPRSLAEAVRGSMTGLSSKAVEGLPIRFAPEVPELVYGDPERLRQIFARLAEYVLQGDEVADVALDFSHEAGQLVGEISFAHADDALDWRIQLLMGMAEQSPEQFSTDALGPMIARGLISAAKGVLTLAERPGDRQAIRVAIPAEPVQFERIRVHLETRSAAMAAIYKAALRSDRVLFNVSGRDDTADIVLVDTTSVGEGSLMSRLRGRYPEALFVSLGLPQAPGLFDEIVEPPHDVDRLRKSILGRLAS